MRTIKITGFGITPDVQDSRVISGLTALLDRKVFTRPNLTEYGIVSKPLTPDMGSAEFELEKPLPLKYCRNGLLHFIDQVLASAGSQSECRINLVTAEFRGEKQRRYF